LKDIKFVFISNYLNHHQIPFCNVMYRLLGGSFVFIQTEEVEQERIRMGWKEKAEQPYLKLYYEEPEECGRLTEECAVALFGGSDEEAYIKARLQAGKPVIRYSERLYKEGQWKAVSPRGLRKKYEDHTQYRNKPVYMLCAGAYVPSDFHIVRAYPGKLLKWGYFPETKEYSVDSLMDGKGWRPEGAYLLWAARMIDWKHPELPLKTAKYLKERGCSFHLDMVGGGELEGEARRLAAEYGIEDVVAFRGYCPPGEVRELMEKADIYLTTSDRKEGWGAVVNEAMNSGCAVVGNHMMGAVPFLIRHGENGMIYKDADEEMLFRMTERLVRDKALCQRLGRSALRTITEEWNAGNAAERLASFCVAQGFLRQEDLQQHGGVCGDGLGHERVGGNQLPEHGPCSPAPVVSERRMYRMLMEGRYPG